MAATAPGRLSRARRAALAATLAASAAAMPTAAASDAWSIGASPSSIVAGAGTAITLAVVNRGQAQANPIDCLIIAIPGSVEVTSAAIVSAPGARWSVSVGNGSSTVRFHADDDRYGLEPDGGSGVYRLNVVAAHAGHLTWMVHAYAEPGCSGGGFAPTKFITTVVAASTPTPKPTSTPTPKPTSTPTPKPTSTPTPKPTSTPTGPPVGDPTASPPGGSTIQTQPPASTASPDPTEPPGSMVPQAGSAGSGGDSGGGHGATGPGHDAGPANPGDSDPAQAGATGLVVRRPVFGDGADGSSLAMSMNAVNAALGVTWAVPGVVVGVPGLLLIAALLAQAAGGALWLPVVRRRIGSWGPRRAHPTSDPNGAG